MLRAFCAGLLGSLICCSSAQTPTQPIEPKVQQGEVAIVPRDTPRLGSSPPPKVATTEADCDPFANLRERREGDLTVPVEPGPPKAPFLGRMRHHSEWSLRQGSPRIWIGPPVPRFVPLHQGTAELHLLDPLPDGYVATYRDPYGAGSCDLGTRANCRIVVVAFERCGKVRWSHDLSRFWSRPTNLEVQDVRVADGIVYYNEACQSYSREAGGQCSSLVALDPVASRILFRTAPLMSNNRFLVVDDNLVTGYGFTSEPDFLFLLRRSDGHVLQRIPMSSAHEDIALVKDGLDNRLQVRVYPDSVEHFALRTHKGAPQLVRIKPP